MKVKIPYSKRSIWGFLFFISLAIMFLFFGQPLHQKIMGFVFLLLAIGLINHEYGVEFTIDKRTREYHSVFKYTFGRWKFLPPLKHILILKVKQYKRDMRFGVLGQSKPLQIEESFRLILFIKITKRKKFYQLIY